ncbi:hypothetical protein PRIPAC_80922 [Pristionchus pacificus]|uniref:Uncharacterized protein n=1 Tax=Pristionchus pacificus TaxID=54126 RepID=A0A2A6CL33_PRIPA|nr:hypothetical protein PRIPAC_80922 [Pristionchus pacificus]|eukprot:PDM78787.1 hypothetical protein PRIPAC_31366 [Pristionchus pacificus]
MISSLYRRRVTGFTGSHIVRAIATSPLYKDKSIAAAGRSEAKVRASLKEIADDIGGIEWSLRSGRVRGTQISCDLGTDYLKRNFEGTLEYVESFRRWCRRLSSNDPNTTTTMSTGSGRSKFPHTSHSVRFSGFINLKRIGDLSSSFSSALFLATWAFSFLCKYEWSRNFLSAHPELCSFYIFNEVGPTKQQMNEASFEYYFIGRGWDAGQDSNGRAPNKSNSRVELRIENVNVNNRELSVTRAIQATAVCRGPDPAGYIGTALCSFCCSNDPGRCEHSPEKNGKKLMNFSGDVYTTASAFRDTCIFEYLKSFGITFEMIEDKEKSRL